MQTSTNYRVKSKAEKPPSTFRRVGAYAAVRILTIALTIIIGIFFTVIVANKNGGIDLSVSEDLYQIANIEVRNSVDRSQYSFIEIQEMVEERHAELEEEAGLNDPFLIKHINWTVNALQLDLGHAVYTHIRSVYWVRQDSDNVRNVILDRLPNTLVIIGLADLLVFVVGIPLALYLSRNYGGWFDKVINVLSPLSSVPSWVHGILLILIFSIILKVLPPGNMIDVPVPETWEGQILSRLEHMILPVMAIFLSLLFQLVYSWRNYFMIYSNEDYVEFATAMGLSPSKIQNNYILRPSLPYVLTSFALTLVTFWQMATALEVVFNWDGIGQLYIISLPNFWGESMFPGEMGLTLGIVVLFAYILGTVVLLLDVAYALVDPRIRLGGFQERIKAIRGKKRISIQTRIQTLFRSGQGGTARLLTLAAAVVVLGTLVGLLFGWQVWPAQTEDVTPANLHRNFQADYFLLLVDSFYQNEDSTQAQMRFNALGKDKNNIFFEMMDLYEDDPEFRHKLAFFSTNYDPYAEPQLTQSSIDLNNTLNWMPVLIITGSLLLLGITAFYFLYIQRHSPAAPRRLIMLTASTLLIGIVLGVSLAAWVWPVQITDAAPEHLQENFQIDYLCMVMDSYRIYPDNALARMRLDALGEDAASTLQYVISNPEAINANSEVILNFASKFNVNIPPAEITVIPESMLEGSEASTNLQIGGLTLTPLKMAGVTGGVLILSVGLIAAIRARKRKLSSPNYTQINFEERWQEWQKRLQALGKIIRELGQYKSAVAGMVILALMIAGSLYAVIAFPYNEVGMRWYTDAIENSSYIPKLAKPEWVNWFRKNDLPETIIINSTTSPETKTVEILENGNRRITFTYTFDYPYQEFPEEGMLYFQSEYDTKKPFATFTWLTPDGREFSLKNFGIGESSYYNLNDNLDRRQLASHKVEYKYAENDNFKEPLMNGLFMNPESSTPAAVPGKYTLLIEVSTFEPESDVDLEMVLLGRIYGVAGTDFMRRDLLVPLLWGMPFALVIGLLGAFITTIISMLFAAFGVWYGGWADNLVQRVTEANMILPVVAIAVLFYAFYGASLWTILTIIVILNAFGSPTKTFRAAFIQVKQSPYIEAAQAYGAPNRRIIFRYMIPRILPVLIPQLVTLVPGFIFLEATLGMFNVKSLLPTWGKVIYEALSHGAAWGSRFWVLEPIILLLLTGFAFSMMGFALDRVLNPRLREEK